MSHFIYKKTVVKVKDYLVFSECLFYYYNSLSKHIIHNFI